MKKKIIALIGVAMMALGFTGCAAGCNKGIFDVSYKFNSAYIKYGDHTEFVKISSWNEDDTTFTIYPIDGRVICSGQQNIILVYDE